MAKKVLMVDDEKKISDIVAFNLKKEGYKVVCAYDGDDALSQARSCDFDLILLDIMMPKMDGLEVCKHIREFSNVPIIMLTAKAEEFDKVVGLELGADDYVTKPFGIRELMARVKANLRRKEQSQKDTQSNIFKYKDISIDIDHYEVRKRDNVVELTLREYELFKFLAMQKGQIFTRESLLEKVWGYEYFGDVRTVDVTVRRLREKIEDDPSNPTYILTKRGVGYYFTS